MVISAHIKPRVISLIPARAGSKGVLNKNMRIICGKPLIDYTIQAAKQSNIIESVYVSSDDGLTLQHAQSLGAIGILRPDELATDSASAADVVRHFISTIIFENAQEDPYIVYLQPTSPLRNSNHIDEALNRMFDGQFNSVVSVSVSSKSPFKMFILDSTGRIQSLFNEEKTNCRRQDLPVAFTPNGAIYVFRVSEFMARSGIPSNGSMPFVMKANESLDIDTEDDILLAEMILGGK